ncbi:alkylation response protein AidB-like acyl-CoA dehydrogenase [Allocatelliglobosispora scoriae]|uniref:Alkylation response protein AidB-like acyl-CoA dehydrogenase n=1 Tax=Allocatelliglobosispora scoriae TaxID=643052 RepID=A0A841BQN0_9ACTN|nr:alkylation response protein AidB-like acyl-CoA dehydrogenase [Allocatelliglobosispora scoriae]
MDTNAPTREQLVRRAADLVPVLRKNSAWSEENRRVHDDAIEALAEAGIFKMRAPKRYGGFESDTRTLVEVAAELGRADGSTSWTASVYWIPTWMTGHFPDHVQDEVFSTPDVRVCGTLSPTAMATPVPGGVVVNGKWGFISGALHAHWQEIVAIQVGPDSEPMPILALVPMSDLQIVDDWYTSGLKGTGSVSTVANEVFVPSDRILPLGAIIQGQGASQANADAAIYRAPLLPVASASSVGTMVGLGRAALEAFLERLPDRKISYTNYASQGEAPLTHLQVADAATKIDEAEFHAFSLADLVDTKTSTGAQWTLQERVKARASMGAVGRRVKEAVDILASASGGSSIYSDVPIQRIARDIQAVSLHALMHPNTNAELYGRVLCGLEPNTLYI